MTTYSVVGFLLVAAMTLPAPAAAQSSSAGSGPDLHKVREGQAVWAVRTDGREIKGKVLRISPASLDLSVRETTLTLPLSDIRTIATRDSVKNGVKIGAWAGGLATAAFGTAVGVAMCDGVCPELIIFVPLSFGFGAGFGALFGLIMDAAIPGRTVLYNAKSSAPAVTIAPVVSRGVVGISASLRW